MITIKKEMSFNDLMKECWSGAIDTLNTVYHNDKEDEFMDLLHEAFNDEASLTEINDFLWFEDTFIFDQLEINVDDDEEEE